MDLENTSIRSIEEAKEFFQMMGCSHFHMEREYPQRHKEYQNLSISKRMEREWTYEAFTEHIDKLLSPDTDPSKLWRIHSQAESLAQNLRTEDAVERLYEVTMRIANRLPAFSKVIVAETINGRGFVKYRHTGLIFLSYHLGRLDLAKGFAEISQTLSLSAKEAGVDPQRCDRALETCHQIERMLMIDSRFSVIINVLIRFLRKLWWYF